MIINRQMKTFIYCSFILVGFIVIACTASKHVPHDFPAEMSEPVKVEYVKLYEKGQILYNINCDKCHTKNQKGKRLVPDFKPEQLKGYELRVQNPQHESDLPEETVTAEELGHIMIFLMYKKRNKK